MNLESAYKTLKEGSQKLALQNATQKNNALKAVAQALDKNRKSIIDANKIDIENAQKKECQIQLLTVCF